MSLTPRAFPAHRSPLASHEVKLTHLQGAPIQPINPVKRIRCLILAVRLQVTRSRELVAFLSRVIAPARSLITKMSDGNPPTRRANSNSGVRFGSACGRSSGLFRPARSGRERVSRTNAKRALPTPSLSHTRGPPGERGATSGRPGKQLDSGQRLRVARGDVSGGEAEVVPGAELVERLALGDGGFDVDHGAGAVSAISSAETDVTA
jgi:hypothetical protein